MTCSHESWQGHYQRCPKCEGGRNRDRVEALRAEVVALKEAVAMGATDEVRRLTLSCRDLGHPDVDGLLQALASKGAKR